MEGSLLAETAASGQAINEDLSDAVRKSSVKNGFLEGSNVQVADEMVNLIVAIYDQQMEVIQQDRKDISAIVEKLECQGVHQGLQRSRR